MSEGIPQDNLVGVEWLRLTGGGPLADGFDMPLGPRCTTLVGPNATGKALLLGAIAEADESGGSVLVHADATPGDIVRMLDEVVAREGGLTTHADDRRRNLERLLLEEGRAVVPEVDRVVIDVAGEVQVLDGHGVAFTVSSGLRASVAIAVVRALCLEGQAPTRLLIEEPGAFLHPIAQGDLAREIVRLADETGVPVVLSSETTFVVPRGPDDLVVAVARDAEGRLMRIGHARGDDRHADLVGGLFRDPGLAVVLDRAATLGQGVRAVLVFEGGTDEAYLRIAAKALGREDELEGVAIVAAGGASAAALQAVVLRAETALPLLVVLDNDDPGRRAKDTLVKRLSFEKRTEVTTYAEVMPGYPQGAEAEDMFDHTFVERFIEEVGPRAISGQRTLWRDIQHYDLTSWAKSAFVAWAGREAQPADVAAWGRLLDILRDRLATGPTALE